MDADLVYGLAAYDLATAGSRFVRAACQAMRITADRLGEAINTAEHG
jgi:hypothetical protein